MHDDGENTAAAILGGPAVNTAADERKCLIETLIDEASDVDLVCYLAHSGGATLLKDFLQCVRDAEFLPVDDLPAFIAKLRDQTGVAARCLEFAILTATRSCEARGTRWSEIDLEAKTWTIPAERIKAGKTHVVPLSDRVFALLAAMPRSSDFVFEGARHGKSIGSMGMSVVLQRMGCGGTVHGFRSSFRDWAAEQTGYPNHVMEMALAHTIGNGVEAAYRRGDLLDKRRGLMGDWATYCS